jgi:hypothetical protein
LTQQIVTPLAQRERKKNPCALCQKPFEAHPESNTKPSHPICADGRVYVESRIFRASPSSVETFAGNGKDKAGCPRRWAARALGGVKMETDAQRFGTKLHEIAEKFLLTRETPDQTCKEGRLFNEGIPHLPKRKLLPNEIEGEVSFVFDGVPWIGYYDWKLFDEREIGDHKTSSDPKKWGLTSTDLPTNLQACTYAYDSGWPETNLRWVYYSKKSSNAYPVLATVGRQQATDVVGKYSLITKEMQKLFDANPTQLTVAQLNEIPNDPSACDFTGRNCDFADQCVLMKPIAAPKKDTPKMDPKAKLEELRRKIAEKKSGTAAGTSPATNPPESAQALEETAKEVENKIPTAAEPAEEKIETTILPTKPKSKAGRPPNNPNPPPSTEGLPKPNSVEGIVEHLAALADILPKNIKITIELIPQSVA